MQLHLFVTDGRAMAELRDARGTHGPVELSADDGQRLADVMRTIRAQGRRERTKIPPLPSAADLEDIDMRATTAWVPPESVRQSIAEIDSAASVPAVWWVRVLDWVFDKGMPHD